MSTSSDMISVLQGYLAHKKTPPPRAHPVRFERNLGKTLPGALPRMRSQMASRAILILLNDPGEAFRV